MSNRSAFIKSIFGAVAVTLESGRKTNTAG